MMTEAGSGTAAVATITALMAPLLVVWPNWALVALAVAMVNTLPPMFCVVGTTVAPLLTRPKLNSVKVLVSRKVAVEPVALGLRTVISSETVTVVPVAGPV